jgi:hypothetical protein
MSRQITALSYHPTDLSLRVTDLLLRVGLSVRLSGGYEPKMSDAYHRDGRFYRYVEPVFRVRGASDLVPKVTNQNFEKISKSEINRKNF